MNIKHKNLKLAPETLASLIVAAAIVEGEKPEHVNSKTWARNITNRVELMAKATQSLPKTKS